MVVTKKDVAVVENLIFLEPSSFFSAFETGMMMMRMCCFFTRVSNLEERVYPAWVQVSDFVLGTRFPAVKKLAEFIQAEAEELHLLTGSKASTFSTTTAAVVKALASGEYEKGSKDEKSAKPACKFWKMDDGCKKGSQCSFMHDTTEMKGRCFTCGATTHVKKECPTLKRETPSGEKKVAKVKGAAKPKPETPAKQEPPKQEPSKEMGEKSEKPADGQRMSTTSSTDQPETEDQVQALLREATGVLKGLRAMKPGHAKILAINSQPPRRVLILDCRNVLLEGSCLWVLGVIECGAAAAVHLSMCFELVLPCAFLPPKQVSCWRNERCGKWL